MLGPSFISVFDVINLPFNVFVIYDDKIRDCLFIKFNIPEINYPVLRAVNVVFTIVNDLC